MTLVDFLTLDIRPRFLSFPMPLKVTKPLPINNSQPHAPSWPHLKFWIWMLLTFSISFLIIECGLDVEDPTPPSPPVWIQKSLPEEWPERGIDAHESNGISLEWGANPTDNIIAYYIYRTEWYDESDSIGDFDLISKHESDLWESVHYVDAETTIRTTYYYQLKVEDDSKNVSNFSDTASYTLLPKIFLNEMSPNGTDEPLNLERMLSWRFSYMVEMEDYCLTLLTHEDDLVWREVLSPSNYIDGSESWVIPNTIILDANAVYKWRVDIGASYIDQIETSGSESQWATFKYAGN